MIKKANNGDMTALTEYPAMLEKAESLGNKLKKAEGTMTPIQLARYMKILAKIASAMQ